MENPYETPVTPPRGRESIRVLWQRKLTCPHCQRSHILAGIAYLAHPFFKVRGGACGGWARVKNDEVRNRDRRLNLVALVVLIPLIAVLLMSDPRLFDSVVAKWFPVVWSHIRTTVGREWQIRIMVASFGLTLLTPAVILLFFTLKSVLLNLRDIAYNSTLIAMDSPKSERR